MRQASGLSERRVCRVCGWCRSHLRYRRRRCADDGIRAILREEAAKHPRYGYRRLGLEIRKKGYVVNHKRVLRLYPEEGLVLRRGKGKRLGKVGARVLREPVGRNRRWAMDFISDSLVSGGRFRVLCVLDESTRECLAMEAGASLPARRVVQVLQALGESRGYPEVVVVDNGPEFRSREMRAWAARHGVRLSFIEPGKPIQNAFIGSLPGKARLECLDQHVSLELSEVQQVLTCWRDHYNTTRPHSSLGNLLPAVFAARAGLRALPRRCAQHGAAEPCAYAGTLS